MLIDYHAVIFHHYGLFITPYDTLFIDAFMR